MPVIPISYLPYVGQTGYTTDDLLVLVNYYDSPYTGVTKNTKISQIKDYVLSGYTFTGNTSTSCINDLYVHSLHGCSPITIMDSVQSDGSSVYSGTTLGFAFGYNTLSLGDYSHAEGNETISGGKAFQIESISNGQITLPSSYGDVTGEFSGSECIIDNIIYNFSSVTFSSGKTEIFLDGSLLSYGSWIVDINNINSPYSDYKIGSLSHSEGRLTKSIGDNSHSEGFESISLGNYSHSEGISTNSVGDYSHSEGESTKSIGVSSHSEGKNTQSIGNYSHSEGGSTKSGWKGFSITGITSGIVTLDSSYGDVTSEFTGGQIVLSNGDVYFFNDVTFSSGTNTQIILNSNTITKSGSLSVADINNPYSSFASGLFGDYSHSEGGDTKAIGEGSHSEGTLTFAIGKYSHAEGQKGVFSIGYGSHAEGDATRSIGESSHSEGDTTQSIGRGSHSEGDATQSIGRGSHSEGTKTKSGWRGFSITGITSGVTTLSSSYGDVSSEFTNSSLIVYDDLNNIKLYIFTGL